MEFYKFDSEKEGVRLAVTGAIHGNETCGTAAMHNLIKKLESKELVLQSGSLLLVPIANPEAYRQGKRFVEENLNRVFTNHEKPKNYEQELANQLTAVLKNCDVLLDLHSIHTKGWPFIMRFGFFSEAEEQFFRALDVPYIINGWAEAYERSMPSAGGANAHTVTFMHGMGKIAAGVECGKSGDVEAAEVAQRTINRAMEYFGIIKRTSDNKYGNPRHVMMREVFLRTDEGDRLAQDFTHGSEVVKGQTIAIRKSGEKIIAKEDCLVLFPRPRCPLKEEFFYTGVYA